MTEPDPGRYAWWLAGRSAGIVAFILIALSVTLGLALAARVTLPRGMKPVLVKVHQQMALAAIAAIGAHGLFLLGDRWLQPGLGGITIPFTLHYRPVWTGLGIVAGYLAALLGPTFYLRRRIGARRWRRVHQLIVVVYVLAVLHALGSGTDAASAWFVAMVAASVLVNATLLVIRYTRRRPAPRPATRAPAATERQRAPAVRGPSQHIRV